MNRSYSVDKYFGININIYLMAINIRKSVVVVTSINFERWSLQKARHCYRQTINHRV